MSKWLFTIITVYLMALLTNLMPSIKYPDTTMHALNVLVTVLFVVTLLLFLKKAPYTVKFAQGLKTGLLIGFMG